MSSMPILKGSRVLFMAVPGASPEIQRITFTSVVRNYKPVLRVKRYFDDPFQHTDTAGHSVSYKFEMIFHRGDPLHEYLADVMENRIGSDALVTVYEADLSASDENRCCPCTQSLFTVVPEKRRYDENGMLRYSGELVLRGAPVSLSAVLSENGSSLELAKIG